MQTGGGAERNGVEKKEKKQVQTLNEEQHMKKTKKQTKITKKQRRGRGRGKGR